MTDGSGASPRDLGLDRAITRRDILQGAAVAAALPLAGAAVAATEPGGYYPPLRTGLRGSHAGSFEVAHALRDGKALALAQATPAAERYDLVIVGGGISGLAAALFYRDHHPDARVLILENHDDFGGHAKRNEFDRGGRIELLNGGTAGIDSPRPYSKVADALMRRIGIDVPALAAAARGRPSPIPSLGRATFFDRETFGADRLVAGLGKRPWAEALADAPLPAQARLDIERIEIGTTDYMPGLSSDEKKQKLARMSYGDYLAKVARVDAAAIAYYRNRPLGWWGVGIDAVSALDLWAMDYPGFQGLALAPGAIDRMGYTPQGFAATGGSYSFHFPDGNASVARLLVRALIPEALPGTTAADAVLARLDYATLDRPGQPVRLRVSSTVVNARNLGASDAGGVEIVYSRGGELRKVRAGACVLACWNMIIPYLCPELPARQKAALHALVKIPLVYTSVSLTNWRAFDRLKLGAISYPGGYFQHASLNAAPELGGYRNAASPDEPILLEMSKVPCAPGLSEHDQCRAGRAELLATPFATYEHHLRDLLGRALGHAGFDPAHDIDAITVNRWPHGYAPEYNPLWDDVTAPDQAPNVIGRAPFGRIVIANSDSGRAAYTDSAIDQAWRAVGELVA